MLELRPTHWDDYELIDSGGFEKLERFGKYVLRRPEPQAVWNKSLDLSEWEKRATAWFKKSKGAAGTDAEKGEWIVKPSMPDRWVVTYTYQDLKINFRLGMTAFKHIGLFPEQASNWEFIYNNLKNREEKPKVLNLFAYTGGASLAAVAAGAEVTHVDSVKQVVTWAKENMELSGFKDIRWVVEDALKYVQREVKRGKVYDGIILDPPAYGRGPDGEKWGLENGIIPLLEACSKLLNPKDSLLVLNLYSMGFSSIISKNLLATYFPNNKRMEYGELVVCDGGEKDMPLSVFARILM